MKYYKTLIGVYSSFLAMLAGAMIQNVSEPKISENVIMWKPKALEVVRKSYNSSSSGGGHYGFGYGGHK